MHPISSSWKFLHICIFNTGDTCQEIDVDLHVNQDFSNFPATQPPSILHNPSYHPKKLSSEQYAGTPHSASWTYSLCS